MDKKIAFFFRTFSILLFFSLIPQFAYSKPLDIIIDRLESYLNSTKNFTALFTQETLLQSFDEKQTVAGSVFIMKPGKMLWKYNNPEPQTIVINNQQVWIYSPEEKQVIKSEVKQLGTYPIYELFLSDKIKLDKIFIIKTIKEKNTTKEFSIELLPINKEINIKKVLLGYSDADYQIKHFIIYDKLDNITTIKFSQIKRNQEIDPSLFDFKIPDDVEIITAEDLGA